MKLVHLMGATIVASAPFTLRAQASASANRPALVVLVAIDQFRGDYLDRFGPQLTGGLARFRTQSALFTHAWQDHAITETAPGHSTMLSGREPVHTGILDNSLGVYDPDAPLIGGVTGPPASPRRFAGTELFDWMVARDSKARVLSVSRKDRGAILPVGRTKGNVYWYGVGGFTTSKYYADTLPTWVQTFDAHIPYDQLAGKAWDLLLPADQYPEPDSVPAEGGGGNFLFPHILPSADALRSILVAFPWMDSVTFAFALDGVHTLQLGKRALQSSTSANTMPDLLSISLSTTDAVGHAFGPDSREIHDQILRLDRWLGAFLDSLQREVPADRMLLVLTSDHGISSYPELSVPRTGHGGRIWMSDVAHEVEQSLEARYNTPFGIEFESGLFYANIAALKAHKVNIDSVSNVIVAESMEGPGVRIGFTPRTLPTSTDSGAVRWRRTIPPQLGWLAALVAQDGFMWSAGRIAEHGTPNAEDLSVPIAFMGAGISPARYDRLVRTVDIAPTLAKLLGISPSETLDGVPIDELLTHK